MMFPVLFIDMKVVSRKRSTHTHTHTHVYTYVNPRMIASLTNRKKERKQANRCVCMSLFCSKHARQRTVKTSGVLKKITKQIVVLDRKIQEEKYFHHRVMLRSLELETTYHKKKNKPNM